MLRALEPLDGKETMKATRVAKRKPGGTNLKDKDVCNGPSKLCLALNISKEELNLHQLFASDKIWIEGPLKEASHSIDCQF